MVLYVFKWQPLMIRIATGCIRRRWTGPSPPALAFRHSYAGHRWCVERVRIGGVQEASQTHISKIKPKLWRTSLDRIRTIFPSVRSLFFISLSKLWFLGGSYLISDSICYLTITDKSYPRKLAFSYLEELAKEFSTSYGHEAQKPNLRPYAFVQFDTFISATKRVYQDSRAQSNLDRLNVELQDVTRVMTKNIEDLIYRGDSLDSILHALAEVDF